MVTAELAVALPALVVVLVAALYGVALLRCADAAAVAARLAARGDDAATVRSTALASAPSGARLGIATTATTVTATVAVTIEPPGLSRLLPGVSVIGHAADALETVGPVP
jgi:hypothetical protein